EVVRPVADELREQRSAEGDDDQLDDHDGPGDRDAVLGKARPEELPRRPADDAVADLRSGLYVFLGQYRRLAHSSRPAPLPRPRGRILCSAASRPQTGPLTFLRVW